MVDLGQKKVDLDPPFFMNITEQKRPPNGGLQCLENQFYIILL